MSLRPRLKMAADMVRCGSSLADIGTDHGYLPAWLVKSGKCKSAVAADLRKSPLENAAETIRIYGVEDKVSLRLSDGLDCILPEEADDIVFAGMGGTLIAQLMERTEWLKDKSKRVIVQPMTHSENVREYLIKNGFEILFENACRDDGRDYICFCAEYRGCVPQRDGLYYYIGTHPIEGNEPSLNYAKKQISRVFKRAEALENAGIKSEELLYLKNIIKRFEEVKPWQE